MILTNSIGPSGPGSGSTDMWQEVYPDPPELPTGVEQWSCEHLLKTMAKSCTPMCEVSTQKTTIFNGLRFKPTIVRASGSNPVNFPNGTVV